nr:hypothetical protein [Tanacetum cinerariifolium]
MDVKSAFLYEKIQKEVYVCQLPGFEDPDFPDRVYKVEKALYGLHQALRAWYETLSTYLLDNEFQKRKTDKNLFIKRHKGDILLVQVYVDDIIFSLTKKELCNAFERLMHEKFQMSSLGELTFFLGLQVKQKKYGIFISQDKYVNEILKKFRFTKVKTTSTPMETQKPLLKDEDGEEVDAHMYRSMIGSLMYVTSSRLDIMFAMCACARYQVNPKVTHLYVVKKIFRTPTLSFMRPFGCLVIILNTIDHLGKFYGKADEGFFVGYSLNSKAFRVFNCRTRIVEENLHIRFTESTPNVVSCGPDWLFDIDALTRTMNYDPTVACTQSNGFLGTKASDNADSKSSHDDESKPSSDDEKKVDEDPSKENKCKDQKKEDNVNNINNVNTVSLTVNVAGTNEDNELPFDPNMPALEDVSIFNFSNDNEDDGIVADMNNLNTTIQVSPIPTIRIHKDHPLDQVIENLQLATQTRKMSNNLEKHRTKKDERGIMIRNKARLVAQGYIQEEGIDYDKVFTFVARIEAIRLFLAYASFKDFVVYQMDLKSVFLYEKIKEEVYVCQPPGFEDLDFPDRVYKVKNALYGLHQAPKAWYETLSTYFLDNGFQRGKIDKTLFIKRHKGDILLVQVYVDDIIFRSTKKELCNAFERCTEAKTASTPMETQKPLLKDEDGKEVDVHMYRCMIGSMMYLRSSRPDIMFTVCACARYQVNPKVSHLHVVKNIFRLISWQCKKQTVVANSITEVEYVAASSFYGQVLWIQNQLLDYGFSESTPNVVGSRPDWLFDIDALTRTMKYKPIVAGTQSNGFQIADLPFSKDLKSSHDDESKPLSDDGKKVDEDPRSKEFYCWLKVNVASHNLLLLVENFLNAHFIRYALTVNPTIYVSCIELFWSTAMAKTINEEVYLHAKVDGKNIIVTESSVRRDLQLADEEGIDCHLNFIIFEQLALMGKPKRKDTQVPQPSGPIESVADEVVHKELGDSLVRAATTASSLEAEKDSDNINKTQSKATPNESSNTLQSDEDRLELNELMAICTNLQTRVLDLEKTKATQSNEIASLERKVKKLEKRNTSRTHKLMRLSKVGLTARVESFGDEESLGEDASKQGRRIDAIDQDEDITFVNFQDDAEMFDVNDLGGEEDKGKGIMIEELVKPKKKDQNRLDEEAAKRLQAKFNEKERFARERAQKEQEVNIALIET